MAVRDILIVEDQALARMYLCSCVEKCADCRVAGTLNRADAALRRCGDSHIDLILMDICTENDSDGLTPDQNCDGDLHAGGAVSGAGKKNRRRQLLV